MKKIMYLIIVVFAFLSNCCLASKDCKFVNKASKKINNEIIQFIETERKDHIANGKYAVYVVNIYQVDFYKKEVCLTMGSISNIYELPYVHSDYVYYIGNEIVLLRIEDVSKINICEFQYKKMDTTDSLKIVNKLIPPEEGEIISDAPYLSLCIKRNKIIKKIGGDNQIPLNESIFKFLPGYIMERKY